MNALDLLASGIHDAKNQLFSAETLIAAAEARHGIDLGEARFAIQAAAGRLNQTLAAYRQLRHETRIALIPTVVDELCEEAALDQRHDGPGFAQLPPGSGTGLLLAAALAEMHVRQGRHGSLTLSNDSALGGAGFTLRLP